MAHISIEDLPQSDDLDREAMRSILGGGLRDLRLQRTAQVHEQMSPIVDYPPGCSRTEAQRPKS